MLTAVVALLAAVVITVAYSWLAERLDYASVERRQLDLWAACAAMACMAAIVYGNVSVKKPTFEDVGPVLTPPAGIDPVRRHTAVVALPPPTSEATLPPAPLPPEIADADAPVPGDVAVVPENVALPMPGPSRNERHLEEQPSVEPEVIAAPSPTAPLPVLAPLPSATPRPEVRLIQLVPPTATDAATLAPATQAPATALPTATPHCGDPSRIDVAVENMSTQRRSGDGELVVAYSFDLRNRSPFPVTLLQMRVTVSLQGAGTEQFASMFLDDVTIEAGAVYPVERRITLETRPPPFGRVQLCVTFAAETCGRRVEWQSNMRCQRVSGF